MKPRRRIWLMIATGTAVALLAVGTMRARGPRFQDRPVGYWFPRWERIDSAEGLEVERFNALTSGGAAAMPVLEVALGATDTPVRRSLATAHRWLRSFKGAGVRWRDATEIQDAAFGALVVVLQQEDARHAFTNRADQLPEWVLQATCEHLIEPHHLQSISEPHLQRLLTSTNLHLSAAAGLALLEFPSLRSSSLNAVLHRLSTCPPTVYLDPAQRPALPRPLLVAFRLMRLDAPPPVARDWMRAWLQTTNHPLLILCATLTLGAWDAEGFSMTPHLDPLLDPGNAAKANLDFYLVALAGPYVAPAHPQVGVLAQWMAEHRVAAMLQPRRTTDAAVSSVPPATAASLRQVLHWLAALREQAAPAVPHLLPLLTYPEPSLAAAVAATLKRITNSPPPP